MQSYAQCILSYINMSRFSGSRPSCILSVLRGKVVGSYSGRLSRSHPIPGAYVIRMIVVYKSHIIVVSCHIHNSTRVSTSMTAYIHILIPLTNKGFIISTHRLNNVTLFTLVHATSKGSRRPISLMATYTQQYARSEYHTQLANMSF